jgi:hypothetical protein
VSHGELIVRQQGKAPVLTQDVLAEDGGEVDGRGSTLSYARSSFAVLDVVTLVGVPLTFRYPGAKLLKWRGSPD